MIRWPLTLTSLLVEIALVIAGSGILPTGLSPILAAPGYAVHLAFSLVLPNAGFVGYALLFIGGAVAADLVLRRMLEGPRPPG